MWMLDQMWLIPALPLAGAALCGLLGRPQPTRLTNILALGTTGLSLLAALELIREFLRLPAEKIPYIVSYFPWIVAGEFRADYALQVDHLTVVMLLIVTGVGWIIHIYSTGYMKHEGGYGRFFAYMNLFMFFMLTLVMGANYLVMFVGWEGVGLCSYLLIGFYYKRQSASDAGKKAFVVNRIGDCGFLVALLAMFWKFRTLDYVEVFTRIAPMRAEDYGSLGVLSAIGLLMLMGATGKSAQVPLYTWLPDAMEGPTPVSALIHAATMVTAGVYMVARSNVLYAHAPTALMAVAVVGGVTALYAATIGLVQNDIKRVLAYSTVSQLGYMFLACGVGAFAAGIFHLMTHAFFKALLFLAAGSVIHAIAGEQDLRHMGGLRKKIPWTYWTMLAGVLAIAGLPGFSGFFSKDKILFEAALGPHQGRLLWALGLLAAVLTAFYMFRLFFLAFHGAARFDEHHVHVHESPRKMTMPLVVLAALSVGGGWMAAPALWGGADHFDEFLAPVVGESAAAIRAQAAVPPRTPEELHHLERVLMGAAIFAAAVGILVAWQMYLRRPDQADRLAGRFSRAYRVLLHKYYVDELYDRAVVQPTKWLSTRVFWQRVDLGTIDGSVDGLAAAARGFGDRMRRLTSGNTRSYAAWVVVGAVAVIMFLLVRG
jgi:NADH-quinone oxidoreductase subunit L